MPTYYVEILSDPANHPEELLDEIRSITVEAEILSQEYHNHHQRLEVKIKLELGDDLDDVMDDIDCYIESWKRLPNSEFAQAEFESSQREDKNRINISEDELPDSKTIEIVDRFENLHRKLAELFDELRLKNRALAAERDDYKKAALDSTDKILKLEEKILSMGRESEQVKTKVGAVIFLLSLVLFASSIIGLISLSLWGV